MTGTRGTRRCSFMSLARNRFAAAASRRDRSRMSSTVPSWSTARHRWCRTPLIFTKTPVGQPFAARPGRRRRRAVASAGPNRRVRWWTVSWLTSINVTVPTHTPHNATAPRHGPHATRSRPVEVPRSQRTALQDRARLLTGAGRPHASDGRGHPFTIVDGGVLPACAPRQASASPLGPSPSSPPPIRRVPKPMRRGPLGFQDCPERPVPRTYRTSRPGADAREGPTSFGAVRVVSLAPVM